MNKKGRNGIPFFFIFDFEFTYPQIYDLDQIPSHIYFDIGNISRYPVEPKKDIPLHFEIDPVPYEIYKKAFDALMHEIKQGNTYLCNLSFKHKVKCNLSLAALFNSIEAKHKLLIDDSFLVFSPEPFVTIKDQKIYTYPMKGTIDAEQDEALNILMEDPKEMAEHATIVDLLRNDLGMVSNKVAVNKYRYAEKINNNYGSIYQTSSEIEGVLDHNYAENIGDIVLKMLPAGSISGAPKKKTVEIIEAIELDSRSNYTGVFGYFDGKHLYSSVMIRCIEKEVDQYYFRSGGGITFQSNPIKEYQELIDKIYVPIY